MLTKEQIRTANDRPREFVPIPEWCPPDEVFDPAKHGVYVATISGKDRDSYELECYRRKGPNEQVNLANMRAMLAVRTIQNEDGSRMFKDEDAEWLGDKSAKAIQRVFDVAARLNAMTKADQDDLVKNS